MTLSSTTNFDPHEDRLITTKEAAGLLSVSKAFLDRDRWAGRINGQGALIPYHKIGNRAVRYRLTFEALMSGVRR